MLILCLILLILLIYLFITKKEKFIEEFPEEYNYRCFDCKVIDDEECRNCPYRFEGLD